MTTTPFDEVPVEVPRADSRPRGPRGARWGERNDAATTVRPRAARIGRGAPASATGGRGHVDHDRPRPGASTVLVLRAFALLGPALDGAAVAGRVTATVLAGLLTVYRRGISPLLGPRCRFHPTCSAYALDALRARGALRGTAMTLVRLAKCGPWHPGGLDPVPSRAHRPTHPPIGSGPAPITEEHAL